MKNVKNSKYTNQFEPLSGSVLNVKKKSDFFLKSSDEVELSGFLFYSYIIIFSVLIFLVFLRVTMGDDNLKTWVSDKLMSLLGYSQATVVQYIIGICEFEFSGFLFNS